MHHEQKTPCLPGAGGYRDVLSHTSPISPLISALQRVIFAYVQYIQKQPVNFVNIHEKNSIINFKKVLPNRAFSYILIHVVTLIAMKREVATHMRGFSVERMSS